jgi:hypothetical protein
MCFNLYHRTCPVDGGKLIIINDTSIYRQHQQDILYRSTYMQQHIYILSHLNGGKQDMLSPFKLVRLYTNLFTKFFDTKNFD